MSQIEFTKEPKKKRLKDTVTVGADADFQNTNNGTVSCTYETEK